MPITPLQGLAHGASADLAHRVAHRVETALGHRKFALWFGSARGFSFDAASGTLRVAAPHAMAADWIARHYRRDLTSAMEAEFASELASQPPADAGNKLARLRPGQLHLEIAAAEAATPSAARPAPAADETPVREVREIPRASPKAATGDLAGLRHRLGTFVVGPANNLAYAAAESLCEPAGGEHPPAQSLFVHGGCGLGKTHLLQGICLRFCENNPGARVVYATGEQFTNA